VTLLSDGERAFSKTLLLLVLPSAFFAAWGAILEGDFAELAELLAECAELLAECAELLAECAELFAGFAELGEAFPAAVATLLAAGFFPALATTFTPFFGFAFGFVLVFVATATFDAPLETFAPLAAGALARAAGVAFDELETALDAVFAFFAIDPPFQQSLTKIT